MAKILVVDDNATNRSLLTTLLESQGHQVFAAADGLEALALARERLPALIISDILMPTMDGYGLVRQLREDPQLAATHVVFYTAHYHEREARNLAEHLGVARILLKPCEPEEILRCTQQVLAGEPAVQQPPPAAEFDREHLRLMTDKLSEKADALQRVNSSLAALLDLNLHLASEHDPRRLLEEVCRGARELIGAQYAFLSVRDKNGGDAVLYMHSGIDASIVEPHGPVNIETGPLARITSALKPCRFRNDGGDPSALGLPAGYPPAHCLLAAPVVSLNSHHGWVWLVNKVGASSFDSQDERILGILAAQVGRIYENGSLYLQVQRHAESLLLEMAEHERAAAQLRDSEERFRQLAENIQDVFWISSPDHAEIIYVSPAYEAIWGRSRQSLYASPGDWQQAILPEDQARLQSALDETVGGTTRYVSEYRIRSSDGSVRWILDRGFPVLDSRGAPYRLVGVAKDVTEQKQAEAQIQRLNRVYAVLSGINSLIVRAATRTELFKEACRLAVEDGQFRMAWAGWVDERTAQIQTSAWAGDSPDLVESGLLQIHPGAAETLMSRAMQLQRAEICNDLAVADVMLVPRCKEMLSRGYRAMVVLPLLLAGKSSGCLVFVAGEAELFDPQEMRLLNELAGDVSFALDHIQKSERINYLAYYDALTGLANRTFFHERLSQHATAAARAKRNFALVILDIERLGLINDTLGRQAGDELLKQVAERFVNCVGDAADIGRIGPDHFAVVIAEAGAGPEVMRTVEDWLRRSLGSPFSLAGSEVSMSARAGIALFPDDGEDADVLLRNADAALKKAKAGSEQCLFYTQQLSERVSERLALETKLRKALEKEEFVLHYQPKVDVESRQLEGVEALLRWQSPDLGLVPPGRFIPLLEETGLIIEVGAWAMRQANLDRGRWLEQRLPAPRVAVNLSMVQLRKKDIVHSISNLLKLAGAEHGLDVEITESMIMDDAETSIGKLRAIRSLGVNIALDDFGTGYSSLAYLAKLPVQALKIDRSFIAAMLDDPAAMTLVQTMISLAHSLRMHVIAEGVESEEQAKILRLLRCDQMQGYLISKPVTFDEMTAKLTRTRT
jgi:diguanylate cyclase (GGDEF)-like protein/PAS domain S-box-containing protein